jgi:hypothetical protein
MPAHLHLMAPPDPGTIIDDPANVDYDPAVVSRLLAQHAAEGDSVDAKPVSEQQREGIYWAVASQARRLGVELSAVFGSRRKSGVDDFGSTVPALLVYEEKGGKLLAVYPHRKDSGPVQTIVRFLRQSARSEDGG